MACVVEINEAAAFDLGANGTDHPKIVFHIRQGKPSEAEMAKTLEVFTQIIKTCVEKKQDAALIVGKAQTPQGAPHCIVHLLQFGGVPRFAEVVISRCKDQQEAGKKVALLAKLSMIWQDQLALNAAPPAEAASAQSSLPSPEAAPEESASTNG